MANYSNGEIYKILNDVDDEVYIGSTTQLLCKRMALHRDRRHKLHMGELYRHMAAIGAEHFYIELIESIRVIIARSFTLGKVSIYER